jgi:hypothetical protein
MRAVVVGSGILLAAALVAAGIAPAQGASNASGNLGDGGTAKGDISLTAGETDTIGVDLYRGSRVNVRWASGFKGNVRLFAPDATEIAIGVHGTTTAFVGGLTAPTSGHYEFHVSSADGSQGRYTLQVHPFWDKTLVLDGTGQQAVDFPMPAASRVRGKVQPLPGASNPSILSITSPSGSELLASPIVGTPGVVKLKPVDCTDAGIYSLTAQAAAGTKGFRVTLKRLVPRIPLTTLNLLNGLDQISYARDGVADYFTHTCAVCHPWASSYSGVREMATAAVARMAAGQMPLGGPPASPATVSLVKQWIATGYGK